MKKLIVYILLFISFFSCAQAVEYPVSDVRVGILTSENPASFKAIFSGTLFVDEEALLFHDAEVVIAANNGELDVIFPEKKLKVNTVRIFPKKDFNLETQFTKRTYTGELRIHAAGKYLHMVLHVPVEQYVRDTTISELGNITYHPQHYLALETAVRSYLFASIDKHKEDGYDVCDLTHCMHFAGNQKVNYNFPDDKYVLLNNDGSYLQAFFHSTCGGNLSSPSVMWPKYKKTTGFRSDKDSISTNEEQIDRNDLCYDSPHYRWSTIFKLNEIKKILNTTNVAELKVNTKENRVTSLTYGNQEISASQFLSRTGKLYGWNRIKSNDFIIKKEKDMFHFYGRGLGHGTGLCQYGSYKLAAEKNFHAEQILKFYYPGSKIKKIQNTTGANKNEK